MNVHSNEIAMCINLLHSLIRLEFVCILVYMYVCVCVCVCLHPSLYVCIKCLWFSQIEFAGPGGWPRPIDKKLCIPTESE